MHFTPLLRIISHFSPKSVRSSYLCAALRNLVVDIGNSRTKIGIFDGKTLLEKAIEPVVSAEYLLQQATGYGVDNVIISSVASVGSTLPDTVGKHFRTLDFKHTMQLPFINTYRTPETLGKDRLAAVAGAVALFPGYNCVVIDSGTCIKYELVTADAQYLGGNIAPGLRMRTQAMKHFTARLPEVETALPDSPIGFSTESALQNGAFLGLLLEMEGFIKIFEQQIGAPLTVILTGGDAGFISEHFHFAVHFVEPDLTLTGLNEVALMNS